PFDMSSYGYNQSQAFEYFPITEEEARKQGYRWQSPEERKYNITIEASKLPDSIKDIKDTILEEVIQCEHQELRTHSHGCEIDCSNAFRVTKQELDFYRKMNLPLPRMCFNCRHMDRVQWRNLPALYYRQCMCDKNNHFHGAAECDVKFETSYAPEKPETVYCEKCYQQEVY
ncbi:MAG TPA: hypothetical protein VGO21_01890, partial [Candidatus Paceibacterota bacterium]|nr:hypothetical protein [Candidatus Paceibacterota bacterium]